MVWLKRNRWVSIAAMACVALATGANAANYYVSPTGNNVTGDGLTWATAKRTLWNSGGGTGALALATSSGDVIYMKEGTYDERNLNPASNGVSIYGGFPASETNMPPNPNTRVFDATAFTGRGAPINATIFAGASGRQGFVMGDRTNIRIDGIWFRNYGINNTAGGGIRINETTAGASNNITIANCNFTTNSHVNNGANGAAIAFMSSGTGFVIEDCYFAQNSCWQYGGAVYSNSTNTGQQIAIRRCRFYDNVVNIGAGGASGGAVALNAPGKDVTIERCDFRGNQVRLQGGAVWCYYGSGSNDTNLTVTNCFFSKNGYLPGFPVSGDTGYGGTALFSARTNNYAVTNCSFDQNSANIANVGVIAVQVSNLTGVNTKFVNNIFSNHITLDTAATRFLNASGSTGANNFLHNNKNGNGVDLVPQYTSTTDILDNTNSPGYTDAANGDLHISPQSPCCDAGTATGAPATDIDGEARPFDTFPLGSANYDIGADENQTVPVSVSAFELL